MTSRSTCLRLQVVRSLDRPSTFRRSVSFLINQCLASNSNGIVEGATNVTMNGESLPAQWRDSELKTGKVEEEWKAEGLSWERFSIKNSPFFRRSGCRKWPWIGSRALGHVCPAAWRSKSSAWSICIFCSSTSNSISFSHRYFWTPESGRSHSKYPGFRSSGIASTRLRSQSDPCRTWGAHDLTSFGVIPVLKWIMYGPNGRSRGSSRTSFSGWCGARDWWGADCQWCFCAGDSGNPFSLIGLVLKQNSQLRAIGWCPSARQHGQSKLSLRDCAEQPSLSDAIDELAVCDGFVSQMSLRKRKY